MKRLKKIDLRSHIKVSVEYVYDHENSVSYVLTRYFPENCILNDEISSLLDAYGVSMDDLISVCVFRKNFYLNPQYHGKSFEVVGED